MPRSRLCWLTCWDRKKSGRWASRRAETARLLKAGLAAIRQEQAGLDAEAQRIEGNGAGSTAPRPASRSALRVAKRPRQRRSRPEPGTRN
jgi:hypothetical protein